MSGGSYNYAYRTMEDAAETLRERHPDQPHVVALADLFARLASVMHDIEWCDSGDYSWDDMRHGLDARIRAIVGKPAESEAALVLVRRAHAALAAALTHPSAIFSGGPFDGIVIEKPTFLGRSGYFLNIDGQPVFNYVPSGDYWYDERPYRDDEGRTIYTYKPESA